jgi:hypothetical protein
MIRSAKCALTHYKLIQITDTLTVNEIVFVQLFKEFKIENKVDYRYLRSKTNGTYVRNTSHSKS